VKKYFKNRQARKKDLKEVSKESPWIIFGADGRPPPFDCRLPPEKPSWLERARRWLNITNS
jgi:hypothetical protein